MSKPRGRPKNNNGQGQDSANFGLIGDEEEVKNEKQPIAPPNQDTQVVKEKKFSHGNTLPKSTVNKVITEKLLKLPDGIKLAPQSQDLLVDLAVGFCDYIAENANVQCMQQGRQMLIPEHVIEAMTKMNLQEYLLAMSASEPEKEQKKKGPKKPQASPSTSEIRTRIISRLNSLCGNQNKTTLNRSDPGTPEESEADMIAKQKAFFQKFADEQQQEQQRQQFSNDQQQYTQINPAMNDHMTLQEPEPIEQPPPVLNTTDWFFGEIDQTDFAVNNDDEEMENPPNFWDQFNANQVQNLEMPCDMVDSKMLQDLEMMEFVPSRQESPQFQIDLTLATNKSLISSVSFMQNNERENIVESKLADHQEVIDIDIDVKEDQDQQMITDQVETKKSQSPQSSRGSQSPRSPRNAKDAIINSNKPKRKKVHNNKN